MEKGSLVYNKVKSRVRIKYSDGTLSDEVYLSSAISLVDKAYAVKKIDENERIMFLVELSLREPIRRKLIDAIEIVLGRKK